MTLPGSQHFPLAAMTSILIPKSHLRELAHSSVTNTLAKLLSTQQYLVLLANGEKYMSCDDVGFILLMTLLMITNVHFCGRGMR